LAAYELLDFIRHLHPNTVSFRSFHRVAAFMKKIESLEGVKKYISSRVPFEFEGKWTAGREHAVNVPSENKAGPIPLYYFESKDVKTTETAMIVLQEWWGINDQIKNRAREFVEKGISCVIPDLYRGKVAINREEASHLSTGLDWPGAVQDIQAAKQYLISIGFKRVFVVGYCMGGALAIASSVLIGKDLSGCIAFYGSPKPELADPSKASTPLQLHFGTKDTMANFSDAKAQDALEAVLVKAKVVHEFYRYEGLGHAFTNVTNPNYNEKAASQAMDRIVAFIQKHSK